MFNNPKYCGFNFLHLWGKEGKMPQPSSHKGGKWLQTFGLDVQLCAHASQAILNHAPIGVYCQRFHVGDRNYWCHCRTDTIPGVVGTLETRHHLLTNCAAIKYLDYRQWNTEPGQWRPPLSLEEFLKRCPRQPWNPPLSALLAVGPLGSHVLNMCSQLSLVLWSPFWGQPPL
jgi:hypothetical protein